MLCLECVFFSDPRCGMSFGVEKDAGERQTWFVGITEGSLDVKLPTIWIGGKADVGRVNPLFPSANA